MDIIEVLSHPDTVTTIIEDKPNYFRARYTLQGRFFVLISGIDHSGGDYTSFWEEDEEGNETGNYCPVCGGPSCASIICCDIDD